MKTYARIEAGIVAELFATAADPAALFHPDLRWVEVARAGVAVGWLDGPDGLQPPPPAPPPVAHPTMQDLLAQIAALAAQVAALRPA